MVLRSFAMALLFLVGCWWVKEVIERLHKDIADVRESSNAYMKVAIVFVWLVTALIIILMGRFIGGLLLNVSATLR